VQLIKGILNIIGSRGQVVAQYVQRLAHPATVFPNRSFAHNLRASGCSGMGLNRHMAGPDKTAVAHMEDAGQ
jgi:hypothetical protein